MENQEPVPTDTSKLPPNGHTKMILLSSNATLFWRVFVPIFSTVLLAAMAVAIGVTDEDDLDLPVPVYPVRWALFLLWCLWLVFVSRTLWRLKRVDADDTHLYATNYWTAVRYPWQDIDRIEEKKRLGRRVVNFWLKAPGRFGQVISFLPGSEFDQWMKERKHSQS